MFIKKILFNLHFYSTFFFSFGWILFPEIIFVQALVCISWYLNSNKCLISQLEYYFFKETFNGRNKFIVPIINRYILYINFLLGILYNMIILI